MKFLKSLAAIGLLLSAVCSFAVTPVPSLTPSRTTGTAPLAVHFDAIGTTATGLDAFRQLNYSYNYGDERGEVWPVTGTSKNMQTVGIVGAHVYEVPGTYTATVRITDPATGDYADLSTTITVKDPKTTYAGVKTICVSPTADYTGCPIATATKQTTLPTGTGWSGKRVLLHRGEAFSDVTILDGNSVVQVGAYGTGANPLVNHVNVGAWRPTTTAFATDITVMDLNVQNGVEQCLGSKVLFLRNTLLGTGSANGFYFGGISYWAAGDPWAFLTPDQFTNTKQLFFVSNTVLGSTAGDGYNAFGDGFQLVFMGNTMGTSKYHSLRLTAAARALIYGNELLGVSQDGYTHALKLHSHGTVAWNASWTLAPETWASNNVVIAGNKFGSAADNNAWTVTVCPENETYPEGIQNVLVDGNVFYRGVNTNQDLGLGGRKMTYRNNVTFDGSPMLLGIGTCHAGGIPPGWNGPYYPS